MSGRPLRILENGDELLLTADRRRESASGGSLCGCRGVPAGIRPREQADLDRGGGALLGHLVELSVGKQEHAASLRDPVDAHFEPLRLLEHRL